MNTAEAKYETAQERMNAILEGFRGEVRTALEKLRGDMNTAIEGFRKDQEQLRGDMKTQMAERDRWLKGLVISILVAAIVLLARPYLPAAFGNVEPPTTAPASISRQ